jgi:hypothetical protein
MEEAPKKENEFKRDVDLSFSNADKKWKEKDEKEEKEEIHDNMMEEKLKQEQLKNMDISPNDEYFELKQILLAKEREPIMEFEDEKEIRNFISDLKAEKVIEQMNIEATKKIHQHPEEKEAILKKIEEDFEQISQMRIDKIDKLIDMLIETINENRKSIKDNLKIMTNMLESIIKSSTNMDQKNIAMEKLKQLTEKINMLDNSFEILEEFEPNIEELDKLSMIVQMISSSADFSNLLPSEKCADTYSAIKKNVRNMETSIVKIKHCKEMQQSFPYSKLHFEMTDDIKNTESLKEIEELQQKRQKEFDESEKKYKYDLDMRIKERLETNKKLETLKGKITNEIIKSIDGIDEKHPKNDEEEKKIEEVYFKLGNVENSYKAKHIEINENFNIRSLISTYNQKNLSTQNKINKLEIEKQKEKLWKSKEEKKQIDEKYEKLITDILAKNYDNINKFIQPIYLKLNVGFRHIKDSLTKILHLEINPDIANKFSNYLEKISNFNSNFQIIDIDNYENVVDDLLRILVDKSGNLNVLISDSYAYIKHMRYLLIEVLLIKFEIVEIKVLKQTLKVFNFNLPPPNETAISAFSPSSAQKESKSPISGSFELFGSFETTFNIWYALLIITFICAFVIIIFTYFYNDSFLFKPKKDSFAVVR